MPQKLLNSASRCSLWAAVAAVAEILMRALQVAVVAVAILKSESLKLPKVLSLLCFVVLAERSVKTVGRPNLETYFAPWEENVGPLALTHTVAMAVLAVAVPSMVTAAMALTTVAAVVVAGTVAMAAMVEHTAAVAAGGAYLLLTT